MNLLVCISMFWLMQILTAECPHHFPFQLAGNRFTELDSNVCSYVLSCEEGNGYVSSGSTVTHFMVQIRNCVLLPTSLTHRTVQAHSSELTNEMITHLVQHRFHVFTT
jgi:hypothetical protein